MAADLNIDQGLLETPKKLGDLKSFGFIAGTDQKRTNQEPATALAST